jgi:methionyl-tRNA synthetase
VPDDPDQVIYGWWDALGNYITSLGYGSDGADYQRWWAAGDERVHRVGKGVVRFHAVYWPAMLLSAGEPLPTAVYVHDYLTVDGRKISKSSGASVDPVALVERFGPDAVRWWLLREVPRVGDADFTVARLVARANEDLAHGLGNLVNRVVSMLHRYREGRPPGTDPGANALAAACAAAPSLGDAALAEVDYRRAAAAVWTVVDEANRYAEAVRPWQLAKTNSSELDSALRTLLDACQLLGVELAPFLPDLAARITEQCTPVDGVLPAPRPLVTRLEAQ